MDKEKEKGFFKKVHDLVATIPEGKVATYGQVADLLGTKDARKVGWALHGNKNPNIPCHRVVNKEGKVATNYAFEGWQEQRRKLLEEGITFVDQKRVDLKRHLWNPDVKAIKIK